MAGFWQRTGDDAALVLVRARRMLETLTNYE
jgi:hypothetical protein